MVKFKAKMFKTGNSHVIAIPSDYIKHGILDSKKEYLFQVKEVKDGKEDTVTSVC